jgi:hypothetical protein
MPWEKTKLHQPPGVVFRKIDAIKDAVFTALQLHQIAGRRMPSCPDPLSDTSLHLDPESDS